MRVRTRKSLTASQVARVIGKHVEQHYAVLWSPSTGNAKHELRQLIIAQCLRLMRPTRRQNRRLRSELARLRAMREGTDVAMLRKRLNDAEAQLGYES